MDDTLKVDDTFTGVVSTKSPTCNVHLSSPIEIDTVTSEGSFRFLYECKHPGIGEFKGTVSVGSREIPFEYKFIVVE